MAIGISSFGYYLTHKHTSAAIAYQSLEAKKAKKRATKYCRTRPGQQLLQLHSFLIGFGLATWQSLLYVPPTNYTNMYIHMPVTKGCMEDGCHDFGWDELTAEELLAKQTNTALDTRSHFCPTSVSMATSELLHNSFPPNPWTKTVNHYTRHK